MLCYIGFPDSRAISQNHPRELSLCTRNDDAMALNVALGFPNCRAISQSRPGSYRRAPKVMTRRRQCSIGFQPVFLFAR
jgi:hypothetical protein